MIPILSGMNPHPPPDTLGIDGNGDSYSSSRAASSRLRPFVVVEIHRGTRSRPAFIRTYVAYGLPRMRDAGELRSPEGSFRVARHPGATRKLSSSVGNHFLTIRDQAFGGCRNCRLPVTQLAQSAVVLLHLNEFMKELPHFAFRCH